MTNSQWTKGVSLQTNFFPSLQFGFMEGGLKLLAAMSLPNVDRLSDDEDVQAMDLKKTDPKPKGKAKAKGSAKAKAKEKAAPKEKKEVKPKVKGGTRKRPAASLPIYKCYYKNLKKYGFKIDGRERFSVWDSSHHQKL